MRKIIILSLIFLIFACNNENPQSEKISDADTIVTIVEWPKHKIGKDGHEYLENKNGTTDIHPDCQHCIKAREILERLDKK